MKVLLDDNFDIYGSMVLQDQNKDSFQYIKTAVQATKCPECTLPVVFKSSAYRHIASGQYYHTDCIKVITWDELWKGYTLYTELPKVDAEWHKCLNDTKVAEEEATNGNN